MSEILKRLHHKYIFNRRVKVLADTIAETIPDSAKILDVGCGDGTISKQIMANNSRISYLGIDIMARPSCAIPFQEYDGINIPYPKNSFDVVQFVDVLHHTNDIKQLLLTAKDQTTKFIVIKDHEYKTKFDYLILKFMDWIGNAPHGVKLNYNFKTRSYWSILFKELDLEVVDYKSNLKLYSGILNSVFGRNLHFVVLLKINKP